MTILLYASLVLLGMIAVGWVVTVVFFGWMRDDDKCGHPDYEDVDRG